MRKNYFLTLTFLIVSAFGLQSADAQFPIKIPIAFGNFRKGD
jgi:hypothetical protein